MVDSMNETDHWLTIYDEADLVWKGRIERFGRSAERLCRCRERIWEERQTVSRLVPEHAKLDKLALQPSPAGLAPDAEVIVLVHEFEERMQVWAGAL